MIYKVTVFANGLYTDSPILKFEKSVETFSELKTAFLKRFGNVRGVSNACLRDKQIVKQLTYEAENIQNWTKNIDKKTRWKIKIMEVSN